MCIFSVLKSEIPTLIKKKKKKSHGKNILIPELFTPMFTGVQSSFSLPSLAHSSLSWHVIVTCISRQQCNTAVKTECVHICACVQAQSH